MILDHPREQQNPNSGAVTSEAVIPVGSEAATTGRRAATYDVSVFGTAIEAARYREYFKTARYFQLGGLQLYPATPSPTNFPEAPRK